MHTFIISIHHFTRSPNNRNNAAKGEKKDIQIGKEKIKQLLLTHDMTIYIENPQKYTIKCLELKNGFCKGIGYKINIFYKDLNIFF